MWFIVLASIATACGKASEHLSGNWECQNCSNASPYFPYRLHFDSSVVYTQDLFLFRQSYSFKINNDSLEIQKGNERWKLHFSFADSILTIDGVHYQRIAFEDLSVDTEFQPLVPLVGVSGSVHFKKGLDAHHIRLYAINGELKIGVTDVLTDINTLPEAVIEEDGKIKVVRLYLTQGVTLEQLIEVYFRLTHVGVHNISLITNCRGFEGFSGFDVRISLSDKLKETLYEKHQLLPSPPISLSSELGEAHINFKTANKCAVIRRGNTNEDVEFSSLPDYLFALKSL